MSNKAKLLTFLGWVILFIVGLFQVISLFPVDEKSMEEQLESKVQETRAQLPLLLAAFENGKEDQQTDFPVFIYRGNELEYWSNPYWSSPEVREISQDSPIVYRNEGKEGLIVGFRKGQQQILGIIPIVENGELVLQNSLFKRKHKDIKKITYKENILFAFDSVKSHPHLSWWLIGQLLLLTLASILIYPGIHAITHKKIKGISIPKQLGWLLLLSIFILPTTWLPGFDTLWSRSEQVLGIPFINPVFLFIIALFILFALSNIPWKTNTFHAYFRSSKRAFAGSLLVYLGIALSGLLMIFFIEFSYKLIDIDLKLDQLYSFSFREISFLLLSLLLFINFFIFSERLYQFIPLATFPSTTKITGAVIAVIVLVLLGPAILPDFNSLMLILSFLIFVISLDLYQDRKNLNSTWVFTWMILIAAFDSFIVFNIDFQNDQKTSEEQINNIIVERDREAETIIRGKGVKSLDNRYYSEWKALSQSELSAYSGSMLAVAENLFFNPLNGDYLLVQDALKTNETPVRFYFHQKEKHNVLPANQQSLQFIVFHEENILLKRLNILFPIDFNRLNNKKELIDNPPKGYKAEIMKAHSGISILHFSRTPGLLRASSLFSLLFLILSLSLMLLSLGNQLHPFKAKKSLRNRIQITIISLLIISFFIIGMISNFYLGRISDQTQHLFQSKQAQLFQKEIQSIHQKDPWKPLEMEVLDLSLLKRTRDGQQIFLYAEDGHLIDDPRLKESMQGKGAVYRQLPYPLYTKMKGTQNYSHYNWEDNHKHKGIFLPLQLSQNDEQKAFAFIAGENVDVGEQSISDIFSSFLNIYSLLFILAGAVAIALANSITRPIEILGNKLKSIKLSNKNEKVEWKNKDEIGALISIYNDMIQKLSDNAQVMAKVERDSAWKEMAKQVAHEIKNPLTPLKLNIQYLESKVRMSPDDAPQLIQQITPSLIEQIDNLSEIASEFSNFAQLPTARNEKIRLNEIVKTVHDFFRKREDLLFQLFVPINDVLVFADRNHLVRILNNVVKNAIQSIPADRKGEIIIRLYRQEDNAIVKVTDNGSGIPEEMRDKVFSPNFTTKSSGTGLGLAISTNMLESCNGRLYFETEVDIGTDFFIEIPLMRLEDNYPQTTRVMLDD